ncbi:MAG TPA: ERCC4 domain-containing protein [Candidatus Paceibacterota bacterium]|nr:ERCC4 domain-containing protein [Candidatus Paceibacterota bacterium]
MTFYDILSKKIEKIEANELNNKIKLKVIIDNHEKNSLIPSELINLGCEIEFKSLQVGDYIVKDVIIERKTVSDFVSSMLNKRLITQIQNLQQFDNKLLIIEGLDECDLYKNKHFSGINENAIRGFLLSISLTHKVPIIFTKNYEDTAKFLIVLSKKQEKELSIKVNKRVRNINEQMQYIIEGFPGIGPKTAKKLLKDFKTIKGVINASEEELKRSVGKKAEIFKIISKEFY